MQGFNYKKATQALNYFLQANDGSLNKMKAIKFVWLADRLHLRKYGRTITSDVYFALPFGPVPSTTRNIIELNEDFLTNVEIEYSSEFIENSGKYVFSSKKEPNLKVFSKTDISVLDIIIEKYNNFTEFQLSDLSHNFPEWKKYELPLKAKLESRFEIDIDDFFINFNDGSGLFVDNIERMSISREIFNDNMKASIY
jgi:uncharacterized phage-associated protein